MTQNTPTPICPKCGYDQSGEIATWSTQCPIEGTCPECGYQLHWPDIVNPARIKLPWFIEHAKSKRQLITRTLPTLWILLIPNRYWRRVTMESPRSIKTYLLWLTLVNLFLHLLTTAALFASNFFYHFQLNASINQRMSTFPQGQQQQFATLITDLQSSEYLIPIIGESLLTPMIFRGNFTEGIASALFGVALISMGISLMWLILYSAFPVTRKRTQLRMVHINRATVVAGLTPLIAIQLARLLEAVHFAGIYSSIMSQVSLMVVPLTVICIIAMFVWTQWFWIAATRIGWQIKAKWWELILVAIASFFGLVFGGAFMYAMEHVQSFIDNIATQIGI